MAIESLKSDTIVDYEISDSLVNSVEKLEEEYFNVKDVEGISSFKASMLFRKARAISALIYATDLTVSDNFKDAIYESAFSLSDSDFENFIIFLKKELP